MEARVSQNINLAVEKLFQFLFKTYEIQERSVVLHFDEQINVATDAVLAPRH